MAIAAMRIKIGHDTETNEPVYVEPGEDIPEEFTKALSDDQKKQLVAAGAVKGMGLAGLQHDGINFIDEQGNKIDDARLEELSTRVGAAPPEATEET